METIGGDGSKTGLVMKKGENKSSTSIGASQRRAITINKINGVIDQTWGRSTRYSSNFF